MSRPVSPVGPRRRPPRRAVASALVTAVLGLVGPVGLAACSGDRPTIDASPTTTLAPKTGGATSSTTTTIPLVDQAPSFANLLGYIAQPAGPPQVFRTPDPAGERIEVGETTEAGAPTTFAIVGDAEQPNPEHPGWLRVLLPTRPNGATGWIRADTVQVTRTTFRIFIDLTGRRLRVEDSGRTVFEAPVAIGTPDNPTPTGATFVTELIENVEPTGAYGPYAFGLALHSDTLTEFNGGPGQVGVHGTNQPQLIGQAVSHGCVRLSNEDVRKLVDLALPLGVPVIIT